MSRARLTVRPGITARLEETYFRFVGGGGDFLVTGAGVDATKKQVHPRSCLSA
jgi:hypothetical protein